MLISEYAMKSYKAKLKTIFREIRLITNQLGRFFLKLIPIIVVIGIAVAFRFTGFYWDDGYYMHPDERYVAMVLNDIDMTDNLNEYFDPNESKLSPFNARHTSYVYGGFPIVLVKTTAVLLDQYFPQELPYDIYQNYYLVGRTYNIIFDIGTVLLIYLIGKKLYEKEVGMIAALLYSLSVIAIQQSKFFTMDLFAVFFMVLFSKFVVDFVLSKFIRLRMLYIAFAGLSVGIAIASKFSSLIIVPLGILFILYILIKSIIVKSDKIYIIILCNLFYLALFVISIYIGFRIFQPFVFVDSNFFNVQLNERFISAMTFQYNLGNGTLTAPFTIQWFTTTPILTPFINLVVWAVGIPISLVIFFGYLLLIFKIGKLFFHRQLKKLKDINYIEMFFTGFVIASFIYLGLGFMKYIRYFLPLVPISIILGARFLVWLSRKGKIYFNISFLFLIFTFIYAFSFISIYFIPHSRLSAAEWVVNNIPYGSNLWHEEWDDHLPTTAVKGDSHYNYVDINLYEVDDEIKIQKIYSALVTSDYIVISSPRQLKSVGALQEKYPYVFELYKKLFNNELGFSLVHKEFSYPNLLGIQFNDEWAEESFYIYDHPSVWVFRKDKTLTMDEFRGLISDTN